MSEQTQLAVRPKASQQLAALIGMEPGAMLDTIKAQCFKTNPANVSNEQLAAFVSIAAAMEVNPLLPGMLYAYPTSGGGVVPIMGPDGVYKKLAEHPEIDSWETVVYPEDVSLPPTHAITKIWRKGRERPISYTALLTEWKINSNGQWNTRPRHFLALRSLKHAARQIIHGLPYDEDDRVIMGEINVTPSPEPQVERAPVPERKSRAAKGVAAMEQKAATPVVEVAATPVAAESPGASPEPTKTPDTGPAPVQHTATSGANNPAAQGAPIAAPAPAPAVRTTITEGEQFTAVCTVKQSFALIARLKGQPMGTIQAVMEGEFEGTVIHYGGATMQGENPTIPPLWAVGSRVRLKLLGKVNNAKKVFAFVEGVEAVQGAEMDA